MAYSKAEIEKTFNEIIIEIESGESVNSILKRSDTPSSRTFFKWLDQDAEKVKKYARACELRADIIFDEIFEIADDSEGDDTAFVGVNRIHRHKLQIDTRKWALSKMNPKKYGDKIDHSSSDGTMTPKPTILNMSKDKLDINHITGNG